MLRNTTSRNFLSLRTEQWHSPRTSQSSTSASKELFEISLAELQFAEEQGDRYMLYRVMGAGGPNPSMVTLRNPVRLLREKAATLLLVL